MKDEKLFPVGDHLFIDSFNYLDGNIFIVTVDDKGQTIGRKPIEHRYGAAFFKMLIDHEDGVTNKEMCDHLSEFSQKGTPVNEDYLNKIVKEIKDKNPELSNAFERRNGTIKTKRYDSHSNNSNISADPTTTLRRMCCYLSPYELCLPISEDIPLRDLFVAPSFSENRTLQDIIDSLSDKRGAFITSQSPGLGCTTAIKALIASYIDNHDSEESSAFSWSGIARPLPKNAFVFLIRIRDISCLVRGILSNDKDCWQDYLLSAMEEMQRIENIYPKDQQSNRRSELLKQIEEDADAKGVYFFIDGLEKFESDRDYTSTDRRRHFILALNDYMNKHPKVRFICSCSDACYDVISKDKDNNAIRRHVRFEILHPSDDYIDSYVKKWCALPSYHSVGADLLINALQNNMALKGVVCDSPRALIFYLASASIEGMHSDHISQIHFMKIISRTAVSNAINYTQNTGSHETCDVYDFTVPLSVIALECCRNNRDVITEEEITRLWVNNRLLMDAFLTETAKLDVFLNCLKRFSFVSYYQNSRGETEFKFRQSGWLSFYSANAIARGIVGCANRSYRIRVYSFLNETLNRFHENGVDDREANMWITIIATAAKLSKENANVFVSVLIKQAKDYSPRHRKVREIAVISLLRIIRNRAFVSQKKRIEALKASTCFFWYHQQIDDLDAIVSMSCYRESIIEFMFTEFKDSVLSSPRCPIPSFHFAIGYLVLHYLNLNEWLTNDSFIECAIGYVSENAKNRNNYYVANSKSFAALYQTRFGSLSIEAKIIFALALNSLSWSSVGRTLHLGQIGFDCSDFGSISTDEVADIALKMLNNDDRRIANIAGYTLSHLAAAKCKIHDISIIKYLTSIDIMEELIGADYGTRLDHSIYIKDRKDEDVQPYCGALRTFITLKPTLELYGKCGNEKTRKFYADLWSSYYTPVYAYLQSNENTTKRKDARIDSSFDNSRRYLMLLFKIAFLTGVFGENVYSCIDMIAFLWKLKYPYNEITDDTDLHSTISNTIGLAYDHEEDFFKYIKDLYLDIAEKQET